MSYKISHDRPNCIGCGACAAVAPDFWQMDADGKSAMKGAKQTKEGDETVTEELEIADDQFAKNKEAAECCPVNVIHITNSKGEKLI